MRNRLSKGEAVLRESRVEQGRRRVESAAEALTKRRGVGRPEIWNQRDRCVHQKFDCVGEGKNRSREVDFG